MILANCSMSTSPSSHYAYEIQEDCNVHFTKLTTTTLGIGKRFYPRLPENTTQPSLKEPSFAIYSGGVLRKIVMVALKSVKQIEEPINTADMATTQTVFPDHLNLIKDRFALSVTQIAELFGVTRKSVYDWYEGSEPRNNTAERMEVLINALRSTIPAETDLKRLKMVWNIPISGQSFISVFNGSILDIASFQKVLEKKILELSSHMIKKSNSTHETAVQLGKAHLAEFDRHADLS